MNPTLAILIALVAIPCAFIAEEHIRGAVKEHLRHRWLRRRINQYGTHPH